MLDAQFASLRRLFKCAIVPGENRFILQLKKELKEYFNDSRKKFTVPLIFPGTDFQQKIWAELQRIPYGKTLSYEELAKRAGSPAAQTAALAVTAAGSGASKSFYSLKKDSLLLKTFPHTGRSMNSLRCMSF
jgi:O6-methylguanine-DNA--protein-cysteine methyltransferase